MNKSVHVYYVRDVKLLPEMCRCYLCRSLFHVGDLVLSEPRKYHGRIYFHARCFNRQKLVDKIVADVETDLCSNISVGRP